MRKVLIYSDYPTDYLPILQEKFPNIHFIASNDRNEVLSHLKDVEVLVTAKCDEEMLKTSPNLKWIQSLRAGIDPYPISLIKDKGIILTNAQGVHIIHMAEYAIAAMIILARNLHIIFRNQSMKKWERNFPQGEIYNATVGIIGLGKIGKEIAKKASLMGMKVIGVKNSVHDVDYIDKVYSPQEMDKVFEDSDYIINLLPHTPATDKIIDEKYFNKMKPTACFINMGRGKTVNEEDLITALENNKIKAFYSDVFFEEPLPKDSPLWNMDNVIITPHISGESTKYMYKMLDIISHNLDVYLKGTGKMMNLINLNKGY